MNIFIASDHAGFDLKNLVIKNMKLSDFNIVDLGPFNLDSVDYPDYANLVCQNLIDKNQNITTNDFGILICGSGQGMSLRANKFSHIRAAVVYNAEIAELSRAHNDCNVICLGSRFCTSENAIEWIKIFITTEFSKGRHLQRVEKIKQPT